MNLYQKLGSLIEAIEVLEREQDFESNTVRDKVLLFRDIIYGDEQKALETLKSISDESLKSSTEKNLFGCTLINAAVVFKKKEVVKELVVRGLDINEANESSGFFDPVSDRGIFISIKHPNFKKFSPAATPVEQASSLQDLEMVDLLQGLEVNVTGEAHQDFI